MPRIDPTRLLKTLTPLLEPMSGAIKSDREVDKLYGLMSKFSRKLVSKCTYINILRSTEPHVLDLFMQRGGWDMVYSWTADAAETKNYAILSEVLSLLLRIPTTIERLKENDLPKLIKNLSRECEREETQAAARQVYDKWMAIAQNRDVPTEASAAPQLSTIDTNLINSFQTPTSINTSVIGSGVQNIHSNVVMDGEHPQTQFDMSLVTHYIDNADLNTIETDFNPDDFDSTVDQHLSDISEHFQLQQAITELAPPPVLQAPPPQLVPTNEYCVIEKDGKRFLIKLQPMQKKEDPPKPAAPPKVEGAPTNVPAILYLNEGPLKEFRKKATKGPTVTKPKMTIGGKPPIKTYEAKTKLAESKKAARLLNSGSSEAPAPAQANSGGIPNFYKKEPENAKALAAGSKEPTKQDPKKTTKMAVAVNSKPPGAAIKRNPSKSSKVAAEAAKKEAEEEKLRLKVAEMKRVRDQRKKDIERVQKEKDAETLKMLKLGPPTAVTTASSMSATAPTTPAKMPKIPKKNASFSDMIGIPGVTKEKTSIESKKSSPGNKASKENDKAKGGSSGAGKIEAEPKPETSTKERKHRPKVFNTGKSRSLGLLQDMEQTLDKARASKDKEKEKEKESAIPDVEVPSGLVGGSSGSKPKKRPSLDGLTKPGDAKKLKLDEDKKKKKEEKETKKAKIIGIQESSLFMDAISASKPRPSRQKRRTSSNGDKEKDVLTPPVIIGTATASSSSNVEEPDVKPVFNFYRDTLAEEEEPKGEEGVNSSGHESDGQGQGDSNNMDTAESPCPDDAFVPGDDEGKLKSALIIHRSKNKPKKVVRWREEEELKEFHFFEMDETERVNVARQGTPRNFAEMKSQEHSEERKVIKRKSLLGVEDKMEEKGNWLAPPKIWFTKELSEVPISSRERLRQEEREQAILNVIYFNKRLIPDSPEEPEDILVLNEDESIVCKPIPYDDVPNTTNATEYKLPLVMWDPIPGHTQSTNHRTTGKPGSGAPPKSALNPNDFLPNGFQLTQMIQNSAQSHNLDPMAQPGAPEMPYNLWNPNPFANLAPGTDMWNMAAAAAASGVQPPPGFPPGLNMNVMGGPGFPPPMNPYGFPGTGFPPPGMPPPVVQDPTQGGGFGHFGPGEQPRFNGPPHRGAGGRGRGRPDDHNPRYNNRDRDEREQGRGGEFRPRPSDRDERNGSRFGNRDRDNSTHRPYYDRSRDRGGKDRDDRRGRPNEPNERNRGARTVICKFFKQGFCKTGEKCDFLHPGVNGPDRGSSRHSRFSSRGSSPPYSSASRSSRGESSPPRRDRERRNSRDPADGGSSSRDPKDSATSPPASPPGVGPDSSTFTQPPSSPTTPEDSAPVLQEGPKLIPNEN